MLLCSCAEPSDISLTALSTNNFIYILMFDNLPKRVNGPPKHGHHLKEPVNGLEIGRRPTPTHEEKETDYTFM